eukprot:scaffold2065_cov359-Prasinococcus_capsulatus_cf.AAC.11
MVPPIHKGDLRAETHSRRQDAHPSDDVEMDGAPEYSSGDLRAQQLAGVGATAFAAAGASSPTASRRQHVSDMREKAACEDRCMTVFTARRAKLRLAALSWRHAIPGPAELRGALRRGGDGVSQTLRARGAGRGRPRQANTAARPLCGEGYRPQLLAWTRLVEVRHSCMA